MGGYQNLLLEEEPLVQQVMPLEWREQEAQAREEGPLAILEAVPSEALRRRWMNAWIWARAVARYQLEEE